MGARRRAHDDRHRALSARDLWLCAGCELCAARCPNGIDVAAVMDTLRHMSQAEGLASPEPRVTRFHQLYLAVIRLLGRSHEAIMLGLFKLFTLDFVSDMAAGVGLVVRGKIPLLPRPIKGAASVRRVYQAALDADRREREGTQT